MAIHPRPGRASGIDATVPQKERLKVLPRLSQPVICDFSRVHQIADCFVRFVWHPHRGQLASQMKSGQAYGVAMVGLDPVARTPGNERRRHHVAMVAEVQDLAVQLVSRCATLPRKHTQSGIQAGIGIDR